jgi:DNA-directed RNA polymerase specialized sigma24 family protein
MMHLIVQSKSTRLAFSDLELIDGLRKEKNPLKIRLLENLFFNRYKGYIYKAAIRRCRDYHDAEQFATEITQQTLINAFRRIHKLDLSQEPNEKKHEFIIKAWLGRIANNCFNKEYTERKNVDYIDDLNFELSDDKLFENLFGDGKIEIPNEFLTKLQNAMNTLTKKTKRNYSNVCRRGLHKLNDTSQ